MPHVSKGVWGWGGVNVGVGRYPSTPAHVYTERVSENGWTSSNIKKLAHCSPVTKPKHRALVPYRPFKTVSIM